ncbi:hypothetical protein [Celerinatantimonas sp. YJH-8]|uniref:hypothetical protein n=1 Tax=Celerinatantimonas sp. YJH-8 TaxID=3228714 RepID=UPI0038C15157
MQISKLTRYRSRLAGWLILLSAVLYLLSILIPGVSPWLGSIAAWGAVVFCWPILGRSAHQQSGILFLIGSGLLAWGALKGCSVDLMVALTRNLPLLMMFVAVSFLSLTNPTEADLDQPQGKKGFWSTILSCHVLGAVINLSIIFVVGDRLARNDKLTERQVQVLMRGFCSGAYWSPFFIASGVAMTYAPGAQWQHTVIAGLILVLPMLLFSYWELSRQGLEQFTGYPLRKDSLVMPIIMAVAVLGIHTLYPTISILTLISMGAPIGAVIFMKQRPRRKVILHYIENRLSNVSSQFSLFLAAGVFSTGISVLIQSYPTIFAFHASSFTPMLFWIVSALMILIGLVGVHPVVSVSLVSPFLQPLTQNYDQLAFLYLSVWGTATAVSPLSGVGLAMISRYQASSRSILRGQWHYMLVMWFLAGAVNWALYA